MYHWTECDAAVLKRKKEARFGVFFLMWHIVMFCKRGNSGFVNGRMEFFFSKYIILHCNFHTVFAIK